MVHTHTFEWLILTEGTVGGKDVQTQKGGSSSFFLSLQTSAATDAVIVELGLARETISWLRGQWHTK